MLSILWVLGIIAGFAFPAFLVKAIRSSDEEYESSWNTVFACIAFGVIVLSLSLLVVYS
ncbi:hypothetical protein RFF05_18130 [Bengtsoniella intestinalis]|uniref:hypothetical protein n=1 Tax=Bengtsoniella intestinalis TaxID=3073143 RepID=UPI00391FB491